MRVVTLLEVAAIAAALAGCGPTVECRTDVTAGKGTFHGRATGKADDDALRRQSVREACKGSCVAATMDEGADTDGCVARCQADVDGKKIGARTSCAERK
jgi:hypothetical protein